MTQHLNGYTPALGLLQSLWAERPDRTVKMQTRGAKYITLKERPDDETSPNIPISDAMLIEHLHGTATYGCPLIGADGLARTIVLELDAGAEAGARQLLNVASEAGLVAFAVICPGSDGHDGSHTWIQYAQDWSPERLQEQSRQLLRTAGLPEKEVYPSQAAIRLPFGLHVRSRLRGVLLLQDGQWFDLDSHDDLVAAISAVCALPRNTTPPPPTAQTQGTPHSMSNRAPGEITPLDDYDAKCSREEVEQMLGTAGWTEFRRRGSIGYWGRPGKAKRDGHSATLGYVADTWLSVFSESDPDFPGESGRGKHYGPAKIYTRLHHGGDFSAAAKALYARGYGTRAKQTAPPVSAPTLSRGFVLMCLGRGETGDAELFADLYRDTAVYDLAEKRWYLWDDQCWQADKAVTVRRFIAGHVASEYLHLAADLYAEAAPGDPLAMTPERQQALDTSKAATERAKALRNRRRIESVLDLAHSEPGMAIEGNEWDADPWLLGVTNGVLDLRSGQLRDGRPEDYIRTVAPTEWRGLSAPAPRWARFVSEVMSDEADRVAFLQRLLGYALNGATSEHVLGIFVGERGRNGKRVLFEALQHVLGDYSKSVSTDVLIGQEHMRGAGSAQPHLMELQGKRLAYCSETNEHDALSTSQVKNITGGDPITARWLHANPVTFMPSHTLFLQTNRRPQAPADDDALWERVKVIEFKVRFVEQPDKKKPDERPRDLQLESTLQAEASGILAWLVRGGLDWQQGGLQTPASVRLARDSYRTGESIEPFLAAACIEVEDQCAEGGALFAAYQGWCKANNIRPKTTVWFGKQMGGRFEKGRVAGAGRSCYYGIRLETTEFEAVPVDNPSQDATTLHTPEYPSVMPNVEVADQGVTRFCEGLGSISKSSECFSPHEGNYLENPSHPSHPSQQQAEQQVLPRLPAYALWHNGDHDEPVTVTQVLGERDGVVYYAIEGSQTGIPADEVEFFAEDWEAAA